ncbi:MAG TPA: ribonuclease E inhibitor RraB [Fimbriimonadaceae bacterium]|jgi:hypothetical protein
MKLFKKKNERILPELVDAMKPGALPRLVHFYLYFPTDEIAGRAQVLISDDPELTSEVRPGADGTSYLLLITTRSTNPTQVLSHLQPKFEELAGSLGGEYDGWEAEVH